MLKYEQHEACQTDTHWALDSPTWRLFVEYADAQAMSERLELGHKLLHESNYVY